MKYLSNHAVSWALIVAVGAALAACGDDPAMMESPIGTAGTGAGMVGSAGTPAAAGGGAGVAGSSAGAGAAGATSGAAGRAAAGMGAAGMVAMPAAGMPAAAAGVGAGGSGTAGTPAAGAGAGGVAAGAGAGGVSGSAAGSGGTAAGSGGGGAGGAGGTGGVAAATFTQVYGLIMAGCSCHVTGNAGGLGMGDKNTAYTNLVGANSGACTGQKRVVAGSPDTSVLFHSVDRTNLGNCEVPRMPAGGAKWSDANIETVRSWIMAGAMNN